MSVSGAAEIENMEATIADTGIERMQPQTTKIKKTLRHRLLLLLNVLALATGSTAGPLVTRFYFLHGGSKRWLSAWLETAGWPLLLLPLYLSYRKQPNRENHITTKLFLCCCGLGILTGVDDYLYAYGLSYLPVSTSSVLIASQLGFNAVFALVLVGQKFSPFSINSVILLTASSVLLAFHTSGDRPEGVTNKQYVLGFVLTLGAAALYGFIIPLIELTYRATKRAITYTIVMEMQFVMSIVATLFCTVGMLVNGDFQALHREAEGFDLGKLDYAMAIVWAGVLWQIFFIGVFGVTSLANSLLSGVIIAVTIPMTEVLGVVLFHEKFSAEKGMALVLALWGFASYLYGEYYSHLKLLRVINAGMNTDLFFSIANHTMTVVAVDALYTKPLQTNSLMLGPGQTTDVVIAADQSIGRYYMAARAYSSGQGVPFDNTTTRAILEYEGSFTTSTPTMPNLPFYNDTQTVTSFADGLRSLASSEHPVFVPQAVDENLFYTIGLGLINCPGQSCGGPNGSRFAASMNNISFVLPTSVSILQAQQFGIKGVFTKDFPDNPPVQFDYTAQNISRELWSPVKDTRVKVLGFNTTVQVILQGTNIFAGESHPIHLHGYDFYIVGAGFGNYNSQTDPQKFNLVDPPMRNTVNVPVNGWVTIRFVADNPGAWLMHCHLDVHITWGLATVFVVNNGADSLLSLEPPPIDLPLC